MPELPEVETTVRDLRKKLVGLKFKDVWTDPAKPTHVGRGASWPLIKKVIKNKKILDIRRRAKFIIIDIEGAYSIFIHQKISGHLLYGIWTLEHGIWKSKAKGPLKDERENGYIRTIWLLNNDHQLAFSDLRRFGKIVLVKDDDLSELPEIKKLGPEPLEIKFKKFKELFKSAGWRKHGRIKQVLMDPFFIAGIGNIYSDEILWDSGYHPLSRAENFSDIDLKKIYNSIRKILKKAIKAGGTSIEDYRKISGEMGEYQDYTEAYHQHGEKCSKKDGGIIQRIKTGGRSAHFCPKHQKLK
ncbi:MAG: DNA-formamidopyrimidine glycosylase [Candidatus Yanofskybacteria bacterium RIFCSPHIGHO2_01_FULL_43_42]|uniref:DNA-formamidopyrimidine glycosylase n=1 Tax=Candidatus Yanofskybacteria bacterium RIFCSPLOWO2_01_FULL_43_22 TaxID=1802695 RepID=A0A1F8GER0_9BACT|nr:MAG: DNA-formamidopyrimidine glycosylase [Candidatus Yanofskybacteria bacterium RIFCSPHIGHO2_01_FULL_43_42]OGN12800.1 MAG: DNA-formamidopyrimidine glycosylase [Candidatus Yanofskybacteria bacterium RIFCSPHIGHO2_02_FULL_43_17]OGN23865.1 MAG: DNA-formamidopyrimidine glycosylase [Candidatus Yanofskybacteria bacterium RIFCSPLOWO2_01_FULL_43_22]